MSRVQFRPVAAGHFSLIAVVCCGHAVFKAVARRTGADIFEPAQAPDPGNDPTLALALSSNCTQQHTRTPCDVKHSRPPRHGSLRCRPQPPHGIGVDTGAGRLTGPWAARHKHHAHILLCTQVRNQSARYIFEWIEFHKLQGFAEVRIYNQCEARLVVTDPNFPDGRCKPNAEELYVGDTLVHRYGDLAAHRVSVSPGANQIISFRSCSAYAEKHGCVRRRRCPKPFGLLCHMSCFTICGTSS